MVGRILLEHRVIILASYLNFVVGLKKLGIHALKRVMFGLKKLGIHTLKRVKTRVLSVNQPRGPA